MHCDLNDHLQGLNVLNYSIVFITDISHTFFSLFNNKTEPNSSLVHVRDAYSVNRRNGHQRLSS